ncbi:(R)-mandelonitrile lyase [Neptunicella marina]|uniref:Cupin domain-containing protein n=1 Tax=Neptunicella marina TaxID=2125989 RepID=A0A8J6IVQ6_9ALTE|nr:cupin domain-containing protein [Neptunicella marina]MBC3766348.1 cupin domain-containing protein [Neptunicella marina]
MKSMSLTIISALFIGALLPVTQAAGQQPAITVIQNGSQYPMQGLGAFFEGPVRVEPLFSAQENNRAAGATVTFEPGSRTNWHTHPSGQTLIVTSGMGWVQQWHAQKQVIRPGDVIYIPANVKHWHGATAKTAMVHIAIQEAKEGKVVNWMEPVSDQQYLQIQDPVSEQASEQ